METHPVKNRFPEPSEKILLGPTFYGKYRFFAVFLLCCGILLAAFSVSAIWLEQGGWETLRGLGSLFGEGTQAPMETGGREPESTVAQIESESAPNPFEIPEGATPILTLDLSYPSLGRKYIHNETPYDPDVQALLEKDLSADLPAGVPTVLVIHTHTSEAFLPNDTQYIEGEIGDATYSRDQTNNILAVGAAFCETLQKKGITAIHCTVMHDNPTLGGSYERAEETIAQYLERYPTISYVIDLHRDAVTTSDGEFVRSLAESESAPTAQVMAVVGTNGNGTPFEHWEENLALALQLREYLNADGASLCRPITLRNASYNQEMAPHALLLEIGTAANSVLEAVRAAERAAEALAQILQER